VNPPRLYVFDWDGTLIDSVSRIVGCLRLAAGDVGLPLRSDAEYGDVIGLGLPQAIAALYPEAGEADALAYRDRYADRFIAADAEPSGFFEGALETLDVLKSRGHLLAVATGKSRRGLDRVMSRHGLTGFFHATRCADETASKPEPLMLHQIFAELGVPPAESLMVGDTEFDLEMAARAGARSMGVSYGVHSCERLLRHRPERIISAIPELLR
jgi:phosphoglycolate phosphatase